MEYIIGVSINLVADLFGELLKKFTGKINSIAHIQYKRRNNSFNYIDPV